MNNKLSSTVDRRSERRNKVMSRVLKVDSNNPSTFLAEVKQIMNIEEGTEIEVEKVESGILLKPLIQSDVLDSQSLRELLKEGAIEMSKRDLQIAQEWFPLEEEVWEKHQ